MNKRLMFVLAVVSIVLGVLTGLYPWWPLLVLLWFGCESYNALGSSCGAYSGQFIFIRSVVFLFLCWIVYRLIAWIFQKDGETEKL